MRPRKYILLVLCILVQHGIFAQEDKKTILHAEMRDGEALEVHFVMGAMTLEAADGDYVSVDVDGMTSDADAVGHPALPRISTTIALPRGSQLELTLWESTAGARLLALPLDTEGRAKRVKPWGGAEVKDMPASEAEADKAVYGSAQWYGADAPIALEHLGTQGSNEIFRLTLRPVEYNPAASTLRTYREMHATLHAAKAVADEALARMAKRYLVVARSPFRQGLQPFVEWKRQEGYDVEEIYTDTNSRSMVKSAIESRWEDSAGRWPEYILLVGDAAMLQAHVGTTYPPGLNNHISDLYYAEHTGDYLPDAMIGRWPVNDTAELRIVVEKTLRHEQWAEDSGMNRALLVAGRENSTPAPTTTNGQVNYIKQRIKATHGDMDTLCYYNPESQYQAADILTQIAQGTSFVNYTAHCTTAGWDKPTIGFTSIDTLHSRRSPIYINNCCQSNDFGGTCFGELLIRSPQSGATAVVGATNSTLWQEDYYWAVGPKYPLTLEPGYDSLLPGAFDQWVDDSNITMGRMLTAGNMAVTAFGSPYDKFYWEIYCLFGDPSLRPHFGTPQPLWLWTPDTIAVGETTIRVSGTPGATVSAVQGNRLLGVVVLGDNRSTELRFSQPADTLPIIVTATMAQHRHKADTIITLSPQGAAATFRNVTVTDSAVDLTMVNIGTDTIHGLTVALLCDETSPATITAEADTIAMLVPGGTHHVHLPIGITRWERRWSGTLEAHSAGDDVDCRPLHVEGRLAGDAPRLALLLCNTDTTTAHTIEPAARYLLRVVPIGPCDTVAFSVTAMPGEVTLADTVTTATAETVAAIDTPDSISHLHFVATTRYGNYSRDYDLWMVAGARHDSFEEGLLSYPWDVSSLRPWGPDTTVSHMGHGALRSAPIGGRQTSDLGLDILLDAPDSIAFWVRVSSEANYDKFTFSIDGQRQTELSGEVGWRRCIYPLTAGRHRLVWRYVKDDSRNHGSDCAWIDDIEMPMALWETPCGWFGNVEPTVDITTVADGNSLSATPSPTHDIVWISTTASTTATVSDMMGRTVATLSLNADHVTPFSMTGMPTGVYIIRTANGICLKIIKQ